MRAKSGSVLSPSMIVCSFHFSRRTLRFGEDSVEKMVDWAVENVPSDPPPFILEVGAGNGNLLFALCEAGYAPQAICGVDYSADAVKLAQAIARSKSAACASEDDNEGDSASALKDADKITFATCDFLAEDVPPLEGMSSGGGGVAVWDLVLDKGTFDAIALAEKDESGHAPADGYPARIGRVIKPGGYFLITCEFGNSASSMFLSEHALDTIIACNFTEDELRARFDHP